MEIQHLETVTRDVDAVCTAYTPARKVRLAEPDAELGTARTAKLMGGGVVGLCAPQRDTEEPVMRPYQLVDDIQNAAQCVIISKGT